MKAHVDGDDDDDDRGGVSERQACVLENPPTFTPARLPRCLPRSSSRPPPSVSPGAPEAPSHELIRGGYRTPLPTVPVMSSS